jgi:hypothetical protein
MVTAATDARASGKASLAPTHPPLTVRALTARFASVVGAPAPKLSVCAVLRLPPLRGVRFAQPSVR